MIFNRKPAHLVTPDYEDRGIFKNQVIRIRVFVIPQFGLNSRGDIIAKAFVEGDSTIDLIFPGRRRKQALKLQKQIQTMWAKARSAARKRGQPVRIGEFRCPVQVEGSWRPRFFRDEQGLETRNHQLYAARWSFTDLSGITVYAGEPVVR